MNAILIGMLAETFIHSGIGQALTGPDLPVARERITDYPFIPGSGQKGGWKNWAKEQAGLKNDSERLFGKADSAGTVMFSDARLLLLPVRSLNTAYVWLTCPLLLERLERDINRIGGKAASPKSPKEGKYRAAKDGLSGVLMLEEREFEPEGAHVEPEILTLIKKLVPTNIQSRLDKQIAIVSDEDFGWFAKYALPVSAHNKLKENKTSDNLWYEETLPPDTVMYVMLVERPNGGNENGKPLEDLKKISEKLKHHPYCQFGGNETLGQGWFRMTVAFQGAAHA